MTPQNEQEQGTWGLSQIPFSPEKLRHVVILMVSGSGVIPTVHRKVLADHWGREFPSSGFKGGGIIEVWVWRKENA